MSHISPLAPSSHSSPFTALAATGGTTQETLTIAQMPSHSHTIQDTLRGSFTGGAPDYPYKYGTAGAGPIGSHGTNSQGGGQPHNNMPPYVVVNFEIIAG